ncbi:carbohydrate ABC transporter permease [Acidisoma silvae]|uniref:Sugar ABC transporter permease n=1 Tax=Acidisoma silvae TaxID=2802396 RepID=A0A964E0U9_9PROT|nr:sugar ABC transporter permease [Acidisoma silvae]MCB8877529.1 sugar ABC transporter permease [Acidisoma silvae]
MLGAQSHASPGPGPQTVAVIRQRPSLDRAEVSSGDHGFFRPHRLKAVVVAWLLLLPALVALAAVSLYPILNGIWLSLTNTSLITNSSDFIGIKNYATLFKDSGFWNAWTHTILFTFASTAAETIIGVLMALLLFERFVGRSVLRAVMLVPWAMPTVVTSKMFGWLFDGQHGVINYLGVKSGLLSANVDWLGSAHTALGTIILADVWKTTPFMALLLLAGLQTISPNLIEAAKIDGATSWSIFWQVRLPLLWPTLLIAGLFRALDAFRIFDLVYVLTGGGPADSTETLSTLSYKTLFSTLQFGYGSAMTMATFITEGIIALGFCLFIMRQMRAAR